MYCEWISSSLAPPLLSEITDLLPKPAFCCASGCRFFRQSHCLYHRKTTRSYKDYIGLYLDVIYHSLRQGFCELQSDSESKQISAAGSE